MNNTGIVSALALISQNVMALAEAVGAAPEIGATTPNPGTQPPIVPPVLPPVVPPVVTPPAGVPGDLHLRILAALTWNFNSNNAAATGMIGDPAADLMQALCGSRVNQCDAYSTAINASANANQLEFASRLLRANLDQQSIQTQTWLPADQVDAVATTMRGYGLLPKV